MIIQLFLNFLIKNEYISNSDYEIYQYGLISILLNFLTILSIITISSIFKNFLFSVFFLISFIPIRINLGGYHCKTPISCLISFNIIFLVHYTLVNNIMNFYYIHTGIIIMIFILLLIKPHISRQKRNVIYPIYKKNCFVLLNIIYIIVFNNTVLLKAIFISLLMNILLYTAAKIQYYLQ